MKKESKTFRNAICSFVAVCILVVLVGMVFSRRFDGTNANGMAPLCDESPLEYIEVLY